MTRLHPDEIESDGALARRLVDHAFPEWRDLPLRPVASAGTSHVLIRLGADKVLRLPRTDRAARSLRREAEWMPRLAACPSSIRPWP